MAFLFAGAELLLTTFLFFFCATLAACTCLSTEVGEAPTTTLAALGKKKKPKKKKKKDKKEELPSERGDAVTDMASLEGLTEEQLLKRARLDEWLAKGGHLSKPQARKTAMLIDAAEIGHVAAAKALLEKPGIRVLKEELFRPRSDHPTNAPSKPLTALHVAAFNGRTDVLDLLLTRPDIQVNTRTHTHIIYRLYLL